MDLDEHYVLYNINVLVEKSKRRNPPLFTGSNRNTNNESFREFCEEIKDFVFKSFKTEYNISNNEILDFLTSICEFKKLINLNSFSFSFENTFIMMSSDSKYNKIMNGLGGFLNDSELYHIYINVFFFLRPYFHYFKSNILTHTILGKFQNYLVIVWIFLVINILFEKLSFIVNKFFLLNI